MSAGIYNIVAEQGATFDRTITWKDPNGTAINLTGYSAALQVRSTYDATTTAIEFSTANGRITLGGVAGTIRIQATAVSMNSTNLPAGQYVYDLELSSGGGVVTRLVQGTFTVPPEVTR